MNEIVGFSYKLRKIRVEDAAFVVETRLKDAARNRYIHPISNDISLQERWIKEHQNEHYFVVENLFTNQKEGLISLYNIENGRAEWGRWVMKKGSLAQVESVMLIYKFAFEKLKLDEIYTHTVKDNTSVVAFHESIGAVQSRILENEVTINGVSYDITEQVATKELYHTRVLPFLQTKALRVFRRNFTTCVGSFEFHHLGIATKSIDKEFLSYALLGYAKEAEFIDPNQGVKGLFLTAKNQPRLELLENLPESNTLDYFLKQGIKIYHFGFLVEDVQNAFEVFTKKLNAKIVRELRFSEYFGGQIGFVMLGNMMIIELIELSKSNLNLEG